LESVDFEGVVDDGGSKCQKTAKNEFLQSDFTSFPIQIYANSHNFRFL